MEKKIKVDIDRPSKQILSDMSKLKEEFENAEKAYQKAIKSKKDFEIYIVEKQLEK